MSAPVLYPLPGDNARLNRRTFLAGSASFVAAALVSTRARGATPAAPKFAANPFSLGVASGDPAPDGVVLWTRLAPRPLEPGGGMPPKPVEVSWEVADDEGLTRVVQRGTATARPEWAHAVHVEVGRLRPDRWYWYQFQAGNYTSPVGRTRRMPAAGAKAAKLQYAFASCQHWEAGLWTAYEHMAKEELDLVIHLGDYIYEGPERTNGVRRHQGPEITTLSHYRNRHALYKSDPALQKVHQMFPWVVTWDDHEVDNNYAGSIGENEWESEEQVRARRAAGYQAWWEHQPVRVPRARSWADLTITRSADWGALARLWVLDTRQYRDDQACGDRIQPYGCGTHLDPSRSLLGAAQERWLVDGIGASSARWQRQTTRTVCRANSCAGGKRSQWSAGRLQVGKAGCTAHRGAATPADRRGCDSLY